MYGFCTPFDDISRLLTLWHGMSRCLTLSTVYVRHLAVSVHNFVVSATQMCQFRTAYEKDMDRSIIHSSLLTFPKFHLLRCSSVAPSLSSNPVEGLAAAVGRALTNYYCETWSHGKREGKARKRSRKEADIKMKFRLYISLNWYIMHNTKK